MNFLLKQKGLELLAINAFSQFEKADHSLTSQLLITKLSSHFFYIANLFFSFGT